MNNKHITEEKLIQIYNFLNKLGHMRILDINEAKKLASEIEIYVHNS